MVLEMIKNKSITYYPRYPIIVASSRLRVYFIQRFLLERGIDAKIASSPFASDLVVFQKTFSSFHLKLNQELRRKGIKTIFDLDDPYPNQMLKLANLVTVDSEERKIWVESLVGEKRKIRVIEDPIDYIKKPLAKRIHVKKENLRIVFFGHPNNLKCIRVCKEALRKLREKRRFTLDYISGEERPREFEGLEVRHVMWRYGTFSKILRTYDLAILPQIEKEKSSTKLNQAIAHNLPVVASPIPSYSKIGKATSTLDFLPKTNEEWLEALERMFNPEERNKYLDKTLDWVWRNYGVEKIGKDWLNLFEELLE